MAKQSLSEVFDIKPGDIKVDNISDYDVFQDKDLLDNLRNKIIQEKI